MGAKEKSSRERLALIVDRLNYPSTDDNDALNCVRALRRIAKDQQPSRMLAARSRSEGRSRETEVLKAHVADLEETIACLREQNAHLASERARLQEKLEGSTSHRLVDDPDKAFFTYREVHDMIIDKFGRFNGVFRMWVEHSMMLKAADPKVSCITESWLQRWRKIDSFPRWAIEQLQTMSYNRREPFKWKKEHWDFLRDLYLADPMLTNEQLAQRCTAQFNYFINLNSIKRCLDQMRKRGEIPMRAAMRPQG